MSARNTTATTANAALSPAAAALSPAARWLQQWRKVAHGELALRAESSYLLREVSQQYNPLTLHSTGGFILVLGLVGSSTNSFDFTA